MNKRKLVLDTIERVAPGEGKSQAVVDGMGLMEGYLDSVGLPSGIAHILNLMPICEQEIEQAQARHPNHADRIWQYGFALCIPTGDMSRVGGRVYRKHCQELLDRLALGQDTRTGTRAETLLAFHYCSQVAPLPNDWGYAYYVVFSEVFPEKGREIGIVGHEMYAGQVNEVLSEYRRKLTVETRVVPKEKRQPGLPGMERL